mmetsp:Transcript_96104/g.228884  ORF Transcript_96104/g.228884 Transcript_96104/m.228884 type:complete len:240 (+) Transcript_96104:318-1037(+)
MRWTWCGGSEVGRRVRCRSLWHGCCGLRPVAVIRIIAGRHGLRWHARWSTIVRRWHRSWLWVRQVWWRPCLMPGWEVPRRRWIRRIAGWWRMMGWGSVSVGWCVRSVSVGLGARRWVAVGICWRRTRMTRSCLLGWLPGSGLGWGICWRRSRRRHSAWSPRSGSLVPRLVIVCSLLLRFRLPCLSGGNRRCLPVASLMFGSVLRLGALCTALLCFLSLLSILLRLFLLFLLLLWTRLGA